MVDSFKNSSSDSDGHRQARPPISDSALLRTSGAEQSMQRVRHYGDIAGRESERAVGELRQILARTQPDQQRQRRAVMEMMEEQQCEYLDAIDRESRELCRLTEAHRTKLDEMLKCDGPNLP